MKLLIILALIVSLYSVQVINDLQNDYPELTIGSEAKIETVYLDTLYISVESEVRGK